MTQALYISHGGGPLPLLGDPSHYELTQALKSLALTLAKPKVILVVSAHWESLPLRITSSAQPTLYYDYQGFPKESYEIKYPALGHPELAQKLQTQLVKAGFDTELDAKRGLDHGVFVPLKIMYPKADIPVLQLSLMTGLEPETHLKLGKALRDFAKQVDDLLLLGSGFSFHNMRAFFAPHTEQVAVKNNAFEDWLTMVCTSKQMSFADRVDHLQHWESAPFARYCHPREEHLLPLHVCMGFAQAPASKQMNVKILKKRSSMFYWDCR